MTTLSLQRGRSPLTAFAFVSYAWVASWFCADYTLAQTFSALGMRLANLSDDRATQDACQNATLSTPDNRQMAGIATSAALLQSSQVEHWFAPLASASAQLHQVDALAEQQGQWLIQSECRLLSNQLALLGSPPLREQQERCQQHYRQMLEQELPHQAERLRDSSLRLIEQLRGQQVFTAASHYPHGWQAVSTIIGALILNQQHLWPGLYRWEVPLEHELAGYYGVSEALFCTALMRLIQAQQQHSLGRRRRLEVEQIESRLELWAQHCPENFNCQRFLLQAEKSRVLDQDPAPLFEQAIRAAELQHSQFHTALCYERYAEFLHAGGQHRLARFCLDEACARYQHWGASEKVKLLAPQQALLAK